MAVIERKLIASRAMQAAACILSLAVLTIPLCADRAADVRACVSYVATALTSGNAADAMTPFDKSFPNYEKLSNYFQGLSAYQIDNEVNVLDEQDTDTDSKVVVNWTLMLTDLGTDATERRAEEIHVHLALKGGKWKIVDFSPISLFNPQQKHAQLTVIQRSKSPVSGL